ncbi:MAG: hypothetical protein VZQ98_18810 [Bacteroidales bacterium]|nr:hypothetical protein [Bacteroidales bacterium]
MKKDYLFPYQFKWIGWSLFIPFALLFFLAYGYFHVIDDDFISFKTLMIMMGELNTFHGGHEAKGFLFEVGRQGMFDEICLVAMSVGLLFVAFARERDEDEYVEHLRLHSFAWAIKVNTVLFILGTWFFFGGLYLWFVLFWFLSLFLIYLAKFQLELHQMRKGVNDEE